MDGKIHVYMYPPLTMPSVLPNLPPTAEYQVLCIFKALQNRQEGIADIGDHISLEEFYKFYELQKIKWKRVGAWWVWHVFSLHLSYCC